MRLFSLLLALALPVAGSGQALLRGMREQARPVLLFAGDSDPRLGMQYRDLLRHATELSERQMRILLVTRTPVPASPHTPTGTVAATDPEAIALRTRFHVASGEFAIVLVGKDGGEKFRSAQPVPFESLRGVVDAMPMRQQEMHAR